MLLVSHPLTAVSCAQRTPGTVRVGKGKPLVPLWTCSSTDNCIHNFECIDNTELEVRSKRSESSADNCAQSGAGISAEGVCLLYQPETLSSQFLRTCTNCSHTPANDRPKSHLRYRITTFNQLFSLVFSLVFKLVLFFLSSISLVLFVAERWLALSKPTISFLIFLKTFLNVCLICSFFLFCFCFVRFSGGSRYFLF